MLVEAFPVEWFAEGGEVVSDFGIESRAGGGDEPGVAVAFEDDSRETIACAIDEANEIGIRALQGFAFGEGAGDDFLQARVGHWARSF